MDKILKGKADQPKKDKPESKPELKKLGVLDTWIVGIQYYSGALEKDSEVFFQRNPGNKFDANAIEVFSADSHHLRGHLPRYDAEYFGGMIDSGTIFIKGTAGEKQEATRQAVRLEVYVTSKESPLLQPNNADDPRALYHNFILDAFHWIDKYSPSTLCVFRDWFRPIAHDRALFPETKLLYRIMKHRICELRKDESEKEWQVFLDMYKKNPDFKIKLELLQEKHNQIVY